MSEAELIRELTFDGLFPIEYYFVQHDFIKVWDPEIQLIMLHHVEDEELRQQLIALLMKKGLCCSSTSSIEQLALKYNWPKWNEPVQW